MRKCNYLVPLHILHVAKLIGPWVHACRENVTVPRDKPYVYLKGHQRSTTIVAGRSSGNLWEATLMVLADNFIAQRITFKVIFEGIYRKHI